MRRKHGLVPLGSAVLLAACSGSPDALSQTAAPSPSWPTEQQARATGPVDDVAGRLTTWLQLVGPNSRGIPASAFADFLASSPVWPLWSVIQSRYDHALAQETDDAVAAQLCRRQSPRSATTLQRCATALHGTDALVEAGRRAWREGNDSASDAQTLQALFGPALTRSDNWNRFEREETQKRFPAAAQTITTLDSADAALASARVALRANATDAKTALAAVPARLADDPVLVLDHAYWLTKNGRLDDALATWKRQGFRAERDAAENARARFWAERDTLARDFLDRNRPADALEMADDTVQTGERTRGDAALLSGWIALRALRRPDLAEPRFRRLTESRSILSRATGFYWLGRVHAESGNTATATADWQRAAEAPETFYGQMAVARLANAGNTLLDPAHVPAALDSALRRWRTANAANEHEPTALVTRLDGSNLARAAQILVSWNDRTHARLFLTMLLTQDTDPQDREAIAALGARLGMPDIGVAASRKAVAEGIAMPNYGWPMPFTPPSSDLPDGFAVALMRQESNFNPDAVSSSNAIGLMQLLPATAQETARKIGAGPVTIAALHQPDLNLQLGTAYLSQVYGRLGNVVEYAAAGYNAGPHRVSQWLETRGDPAHNGGDQDAMIDWIEQIPLHEPRDYVKRVWESIAIYATRR